MVNIAVFVSGSGTNLQALIDAEKNGALTDGKIIAVISSKPDVYALERARIAGIKTMVVPRKGVPAVEYNHKLFAAVQAVEADLIVLAGFLSILGKEITDCYKDRIINVHPSLIPAFCGDGFYGLKVHQAVLDYGVKITGATVHFVNEVTDGGKIILQKAVAIQDTDTPQTLQKRVMEEAEWEILPKAVQIVCRSLLNL